MQEENYKAWNVSKTTGSLEDVVAYGLLAPSSHNTQPWKFEIVNNAIHIIADYSRSLPYSDRYNREFFITLGCAWANCEIAAKYFGYEVKSEILPEDALENIVIRLTCVRRKKNGTSKDIIETFQAITQRRTNRFPHIDKKIPMEAIEQCVNHDIDTAIKVHVIDEIKKKTLVAEIAAGVADFVYQDPVFKKELQEWLRPVTTKQKDGIALFDAGVSAGETEKIVKNIVNADAKREAENDRKVIQSSTSLLIATSEEDTEEFWLRAGRVVEYCWLYLTHYDIAVAPMTGLIEHPQAHIDLMKIMHTKNRPLFFARIGYPQQSTHVSPRRPIEDVLKRSL
jgi:nitroreductase